MAKAKTSEILSKPYSRLLVRDEDGGFAASIIEFSGCYAQGDTAAEAAANLEEAAEAWLEAAFDNGCDIPEPTGDNEYSGKFIVRVPRSLHRRCALLAQQEGVSLNQYVVSILAQYAGEKKAESRLEAVAGDVRTIRRLATEYFAGDSTHAAKRYRAPHSSEAEQTASTDAQVIQLYPNQAAIAAK